MSNAPKAQMTEAEVAHMQAVAEGIDDTPVIEFNDKKFRLAKRTGHVPMMKFAHYAEAGVDSEDMGGMAAFYEVLQDCILAAEDPCKKCENCKNGLPCSEADPGDWGKFERELIKSKATIEEIMPIMQEAMEKISARPTK
jgi:hypothetical protein